MSRTTYVWESTLSTVNLRKSKYKLSISDENLASELRCAKVQNAYQILKTSHKKKIKYVNIFKLITS